MNHEVVPAPCSWTSADECAMARERSVASISSEIPLCEVHGPYPVSELLELSNTYRAIFTDRDGVEAGFRLTASNADEAKERACVAYAEAFRRSPAEDHCTLTVETITE